MPKDDTPPIELAATVERVDEGMPEPEAAVWWTRNGKAWYSGYPTTLDEARKEAEGYTEIIPVGGKVRLVRISPAPSPAETVEWLPGGVRLSSPAPSPAETIKAALGRLSAAMEHPCLDFTESRSIEAALIDFAAAKIREVGWPMPEASPAETGAVPVEETRRLLKELRQFYPRLVPIRLLADFERCEAWLATQKGTR